MLTYETGTFIVDSDGEVAVDFLFDGGSFQGELGIFSLEEMDTLEPGSTEFLAEALTKAQSDSLQGYSLIDDAVEGARFEANLGYEANFNRGEYQGVKTLAMNPGDEVGFVLAPKTSLALALENLDNILEFDEIPIVSIPEANIDEFLSGTVQFVDVDGNGTVAIDDLPVNRANPDYNDVIYQVQGLDGNLSSIEELIDRDRDWRSTIVGQNLLTYARNRISSIDTSETEIEAIAEAEIEAGIEAETESATEVEAEAKIDGTFSVGESGEVTVDYLFDGGFFQGEVGIFSLEDLNPEDFGSIAFIEEVVERVSSNSTQGHIVLRDREDGAKFNSALPWEGNFDRGEYSGSQAFAMNQGDTFGLVLVADGTFDELSNEELTSDSLLFSLPDANSNSQDQIARVLREEDNTIIGWSDTETGPFSSTDYNDLIMGISGVVPIGTNAISDVIANDRNWLETQVGEDILNNFSSEDT